MYPPLRVFDIVTKSASFSLPDEDVAHPSPYLYFDTSGGAVDAVIDGNTFIYASEVIIVKFGGASPAGITAPADWLTPGTTLLPAFDTAPLLSSWRVLIDGVGKLVTVLSSSSGGGGTSVSPVAFKFHGALALSGAGVVTGYLADAIANSTSATSLGYNMPRDIVFSDLYLNVHTNTADQRVTVSVRKNDAPTALTIPLILAGFTGVTHLGSVAVPFGANDLLDVTATSEAAGSGTFDFTAVVYGLLTP